MNALMTLLSLSTKNVDSAANDRKKTSDVNPSTPFATPWSRVLPMSGMALLTSSVADVGLSTPALLRALSTLSTACDSIAEMSSDCDVMPLRTSTTTRMVMATRPSRTSAEPPARGTRWRSSALTIGPATAPRTPARITGMTIVEV
jgi:hypothetical protein